MLTPQQIDEISFNRVPFGGYDMQAVDEILEPLTEDYILLYKENALLKSKMKVLVNKLDEYRSNEESMKEAIANTQATCDEMIQEAEAKCTQILAEAGASAAEHARNADSLIDTENARVEEARRLAASRITDLQDQIRGCIQALEVIKNNNKPMNEPVLPFDYERSEALSKTSSLADEISANLQELVGTTDDSAPMADPMHPTADTTSKFTNLQFGRNYENN